jgi:glycosyltransferase involved in cell wall biosynthesis
MRLGFVHHWSRPYETSWSGTPWQLRRTLAERTTVIDLGMELSDPTRQALRAVGLRRTPTGWRSMWRQHELTQRIVEHRIKSNVRAETPDVILEIQDLVRLPRPYMVLQDLNYRLLLEHFGRGGVPHFRQLSRRRVDALLARQERIYESAAILLPMSRWLADSLRRSGIEEGRIRVLNPGVNASRYSDLPVAERRLGSTMKLLFVGRDFDTKGGAQVVKAFALLRESYGDGIRLTIAGPRRWPLDCAIPIGIDFLGPVSASVVGDLMDKHDLFVMPSLFEGFGIVFAEALIRGLPCVARNSCAMPEIVDRKSGGRLVNSESPDELAAVIVEALADDDLYRECALRVGARRQHFSWERAADEVMVAAKMAEDR